MIEDGLLGSAHCLVGAPNFVGKVITLPFKTRHSGYVNPKIKIRIRQIPNALTQLDAPLFCLYHSI